MKGSGRPKMLKKAAPTRMPGSGAKPTMTRGQMPAMSKGSAPHQPVKATHGTGKHSGKHIARKTGMRGRKFINAPDSDNDGM